MSHITNVLGATERFTRKRWFRLMSLISVERRQVSLVPACFSVRLPHSAPLQPPTAPSPPPARCVPWGEAGQGFKVLIHTLRAVLAAAFTSSPNGTLRVPPSPGAYGACALGHGGWAGLQEVSWEPGQVPTLASNEHPSQLLPNLRAECMRAESLCFAGGHGLHAPRF